MHVPDAASSSRSWIVLSGLLLFLGMGLLLPVHAQDGSDASGTEAAAGQAGTAGEGADEAEVTIVEIDWFAKLWPADPVGRAIMIALGGLLIGATAFTIERAWMVRRRYFAPRRLIRRIQPLWDKGRFNDVAEICRKDPSILAQVALYIARHYKAPYEILMNGASDIGARELKRQYQKAYPLAVIAMLSPLLGLLGTVIGMIGAFNTVAQVGEMGDASVLAGDIGLALITTAVGLVIAIPTLGIYHFFRQRISMYGNAIEERMDELSQAWLRPLQEVEEWKDEAQPVSEPVKPAEPDPSNLPAAEPGRQPAS
jgi:biopolymer transport protein ExbB